MTPNMWMELTVQFGTRFTGGSAMLARGFPAADPGR